MFGQFTLSRLAFTLICIRHYYFTLATQTTFKTCVYTFITMHLYLFEITLVLIKMLNYYCNSQKSMPVLG